MSLPALILNMIKNMFDVHDLGMISLINEVHFQNYYYVREVSFNFTSMGQCT